MFTRTVIVLLGLIAWTGTSTASQPASYATCVACHGAAGEGNLALKAPALAGQDAAYLARQLEHFKSGVRGANGSDPLGMQMRPMAATLSADDIAEISAWLAGLATPSLTSIHEGNLKNGNDYYHSKCDACHGAFGEGNARLNAPAIAWLDAAYIKRQYNHFRSGIRGSHAQDTYGKQMQLMSDVLPEDAFLDDIITYMQSRALAEGAQE